jgi:hypothetical protein
MGDWSLRAEADSRATFPEYAQMRVGNTSRQPSNLKAIGKQQGSSEGGVDFNGSDDDE